MSQAQHKFALILVIIGLGIAIELFILAVDFSLISVPSFFSSTETIQIQFTGEAQKWTFLYAGEDQQFNTQDDVKIQGSQDLLIPASHPILIELKSKDYLYCLDIPELQKTQIAVPDMKFDLQLLVEEPNSFSLIPGSICGRINPALSRELIVVSNEEFKKWLNEQSEVANL